MITVLNKENLVSMGACEAATTRLAGLFPLELSEYQEENLAAAEKVKEFYKELPKNYNCGFADPDGLSYLYGDLLWLRLLLYEKLGWDDASTLDGWLNAPGELVSYLPDVLAVLARTLK